MDTADQNPVIALVPQDNTAIDDAINDLDTKIAIWIEAMDRASVVLAQVARAETAAPKRTNASTSHKATESAKNEGVRLESVAGAGKEADASAQTVVELPGGGKSKAGGSPEKSAAKSAKSSSGLGAKLRRLVGGGESDEVEATPKSSTVSKVDKPKNSDTAQKSKEESVDEDEALLAQLDPKTAKSIRIKRRLSRGKKSVRDLINESNT